MLASEGVARSHRCRTPILPSPILRHYRLWFYLAAAAVVVVVAVVTFLVCAKRPISEISIPVACLLRVGLVFPSRAHSLPAILESARALRPAIV